MESKTMFCPNCGEKILRDSNYCPYCGHKNDFSFKSAATESSSENVKPDLKKDEEANQIKQVKIPEKEDVKNQVRKEQSEYSENKDGDLPINSQDDLGANSLKETPHKSKKLNSDSSETSEKDQASSNVDSKKLASTIPADFAPEKPEAPIDESKKPNLDSSKTKEEKSSPADADSKKLASTISADSSQAKTAEQAKAPIPLVDESEKSDPDTSKTKENQSSATEVASDQKQASANSHNPTVAPVDESEKSDPDTSKTKENQSSASEVAADQKQASADSQNAPEATSINKNDGKEKKQKNPDHKENEVASAKSLEPARSDRGINIQFTNSAFRNIFRWLSVNIYVTVIGVLALFVVFSFSTLFGWIGAIICLVAVFLVANNSQMGKTNMESSIRDKVKSSDRDA